MRRTRTICAAPRRGPGETWGTISALIAATLDQSDAIDGGTVSEVLASAAKAGLPLVAGGHLEKSPIVLLAPPIHLSIFTVSGDRALSTEEILSPVPGGTSSREWKIHLPAVDPLVSVVKSAANESAHLSGDPAPEEAEISEKSTVVIDREALARRGQR